MAEKVPGDTCPECKWPDSELPEAPHHLPPRTILNNVYLTGRVLSEDEFGIIYLAMEMSSREKLVIKEFFPRSFVTRHHNTVQVRESNESLQDFFTFGLGQFIEEGMALLNSRDVAGLQRTHDLFRLNGTAYQVMDHIEGISLETTLSLLGKVLSFQNVLKIVFPIMNALEHLHNTGLLHYDIHPGNIVVTGEGSGVLVNFSASNFAIAQRENNLSSILRPGFSPPELYIKDDAFTPQSDIYSLAASIHRAITGSNPPNALSRLENDSIKMPAKLNPTVSEKGQEALMKGLAVRPAARYQNISDFRREILSGMKVKDSKTKGTKQQPQNPQDAFSAITCPVCATRNEVLKTDLKLGTSQCRACGHPFILDDENKLTKPDTFQPTKRTATKKAPAPRKPASSRQRIKPSKKAPPEAVPTQAKAKGRKPAANAFTFTIVKCKKCLMDNEVLLNDLQAGALCFNCASVLSDSIEHVASAENGKTPGHIPSPSADTAPPMTSQPAAGETQNLVEAPPKPAETPTQKGVEPPVHVNGNHKSTTDRPKRTRRPRIPFTPPPPPDEPTRIGGFLDDTGEFDAGDILKKSTTSEETQLSDTQARLTCPECSYINLVPVAGLTEGAYCQKCNAVLLHIAEDARSNVEAEVEKINKPPAISEPKPEKDPEITIDEEDDLPPFDASLYDIRPEEPTKDFSLDSPVESTDIDDPDKSVFFEDPDGSVFLDLDGSAFDGEELLLKPEAPTQEFDVPPIQPTPDEDQAIFDGEELRIEPEAPTKEFEIPPDQIHEDDSRWAGEESTLFHLNDGPKPEAIDHKQPQMLPPDDEPKTPEDIPFSGDQSILDLSGDPSILDLNESVENNVQAPADPSILDMDAKTFHQEEDSDRITEADLFPVIDQSEPEELDDSSNLSILTCRRCGRKNSYHPESVKDGLRCRYCKNAFDADQTSVSVRLSPEQKNELLNLSDSNEIDEEQSVTVIACPKCKTRNFVQASSILEGAACSRCNHPFLSTPMAPQPEEAVAEVDESFEEELPYDIGNESKKKLLFVGTILAVLLTLIGGVFYWAIGNLSEQEQLNQHLQAARIANQNQNFTEAINQLKSALAIQPENEKISIDLENMQQNLERKKQLEEEEKRQQSFFESEKAAADSLFAIEKYEESQWAYEILLVEQPEDSFLLDRLATIAEKLKKPTPRRESRPSTASRSVPVSQRLQIRSGGDLQSYIRRAKPNSVIKLSSGIYTLSAPLIIDKSISLEGDGMNKSLIVSNVAGNSIEIRGGAVFKADKIGIELQSGQQGNLIYVSNGEVDIRRSLLKGALKSSGKQASSAVWFDNRGRGKLHANQISSNNIGVRISGSSDPVLTDNDMLNNKVAVEIGDQAKSLIRGNRIKGNKLDGIHISGTANPLIESNTITENRRDGIRLEMEKGGGTLRNNQITYNNELGILLASASAPSIEKNKIRSNSQGGIHYRENSGGSCQNNEIAANKLGIRIANNASPRIWENSIKQNEGDGIEIMNKAKPRINKNTISSNDGDGISLVLDQNGGEITNNQSLSNRGYGISFLNDNRPTSLLNNTTNGNYEGHIYEEGL